MKNWRQRLANLRSEVRFARRPVTLGRYVRVSRAAVLETGRGAREEIRIGDRTVVHAGAMLMTHGGRISIGRDCSINPYAVLYGHGGLELGNDVRVASHCVVIPADHVFDDPKVPIRLQGETRRGIRIEDDVWLATGVTVLDGCTVGRGSVVAAGAVVTEDVPPMTVVGGIPARQLGRRGAERID